MKKKRLRLLAVLIITSLTFSACGGAFPEMTDTEIDEVGEYAARLLLKYDANHRSRLVSMEEVEAKEAKEKERREKKAAQEAARQEAEQNSGMDPVDETTVIDHSQSLTGDNAVISVGSVEEFLELPQGLKIDYNGYEVTDDLASDFFTIEASEGKRLLLLHFQITNQMDVEQVVDILSKNAVFKITVNGNYTRSALTTMLMEDLSTYRETIAAGGGADTLLVFEVDQTEADFITALSLNLKNESKTYTIQLQ